MQAMQDVIHEPLKCLGGVSKAEGHPQEFEEAKRGGHSCLRNILLGYWDLMVCPDQINVGEDGCTL
jgi:hypothetical protein